MIRRVRADDPAAIRIPDLPDGAGAAVFLDVAADGTEDSRIEAVCRMAEAHGGDASRIWCGRGREDRGRMRDMRHAIPRSIFEYVASLKGAMPGIHKMGTDMAVPDDRADEMMSFYREKLEEAGLEYVVFGHLGNNHPHVEIILKSMDDFERAKTVYAEFARKAVELGGSPSAEHGIGKIKREYMRMMYGDEGIEELRCVKSVIDPKGILCPGNILEERR